MVKIALFASGSGTNAGRIMDHFQNHPDIKVAILLSNNPQAYALQRAKSYGVPCYSFNRNTFYESNEILKVLEELDVSFIFLAGFLWLVPKELVEAYPNRLVNIHPALLPKYGGSGMYGMNVHRAVYQNREPESGITIHYVNTEYDRGEIIHQRKCPLEPGDEPADIAKKIQKLEHSDYPKVIENIIRKSGKNS